jgi:glyoxylase-like metal-dependent hydrolase (beta-lactamase superfamily II)
LPDPAHRPVTGGNWYETKKLDDGISLIRESHIKPFYRCNIWHVRGRDRDLLVDSGMGVVSLRDHVQLVCERPLVAVASHAHFDHIGGHHEFSERAVHAAEAEILAYPSRRNTVADLWVSDSMFTVLPAKDYKAADYEVRPAPATRLLQEGDVVDLGDRHFQIIHLPGHSPGSIALWEEASGILFSGDVVYDGELLDNAYHSNVDHYLASMERLRKIPARVVHAGHFASFGRTRLLALIDDYVAGRRMSGCPSSKQ